MARFVPVKLNVDHEGKEVAGRYSVPGLPTVVFVDGTGREVDRLVGYLPPDDMVAGLERIASGDTFAACVEKLEAGEESLELVKRVARGYLERSEGERAIALLKSDRASRDAACRRLLFQARADLHRRAYNRAARALVHGKGEPPTVSGGPGRRHLAALLAASEADRTPAEWGPALRQARTADCAELLDTLGKPEGARVLLEAADIAMAGGLYRRAAGCLTDWWHTYGSKADAGQLNQAAWNLYLMRLELPTALEMAEKAHAADPDPSIADTLARLLYVNGRVDRAVQVEQAAAEAITGSQKEGFEKAVQLMREGKELEDSPPFESFAVPPSGG